MWALWSTYGSRGDVEPMVGLAVQLRALGAERRVCAAADLPPRAADLVATQFGTVASASQVCDAPLATGVMPTGVWQ
jgi:vancomycin aglycone glucosyltransferase